MFGWKALHNGLAVNVNLAKRGLHIDQKCPRCGDANEALEHMLMTCADSRKAWYFSPLRIDVAQVNCGRFRDWVFELNHNNKDEEWWVLFWMMCWNIWVGRNAWVFDRKQRDFMSLIDKAVQGGMEYAAANTRKGKKDRVNEVDVRWKPPAEGTYKLNTDVALLGGNLIGMGGVVRDFEGDVVAAFCCRKEATNDVAVAEALSARLGVKDCH
ncbi:uncharacterized protein LOC130590756 [Beta vulgaris subsp. vulgaris]|uniref:uncharacterized protein LOC130590756 n=1 Tax=Beta vulgaris subsp. vulgaris TaxID=3555 RepID=UPI002546D52C|nr:uncharacterized protein LOC130590756 [Beta vulgaris subsp. vulgaris]